MPADRIVLTNQFLIAMPGMADEAFAGTVVYLCEHNDNGALGLVIHAQVAAEPDEGAVQKRFHVPRLRSLRAGTCVVTLARPRLPGDQERKRKEPGIK